MGTPDSVDDYIAAASADVRPVLSAVRAAVRQAAPHAEERISYRMPAYFQNGVVIYFAAFQNHLGVYPPVRDPTLKAALAQYLGPKDNLRFSLAQPIPLDLIEQIVQSRLLENTARKPTVRKKRIPLETSMTDETKPKGPASYFPSIEKKYGQPMQHWFNLIAEQKGRKHMEIVNWLKTEHAMGHGHANAVVAHCLAQKA